MSRITPLSRYGERGAKGEWEVLSSGSTVDREDERERETAMTQFRWRGGKKVVDALRISDHNLISLLLTTQRC
ncbi:enoyl-CoA hydratase [Burkholderia sp. MSMB1589WGS]|uniref:enoyl-CoA hydratase n=1 Tax=Burkholderia sp. MSMB1589WGS TaxID=1636425 RepID=UPI000AAD98F1|nr:enoyl-CoA hydratase [Burkholderia sp. MSMB1589WGS]